MNLLGGNTLKADVEKLKDLYKNLNIFDINLRENNAVIANLINDLSWTEFLLKPNNALFQALQLCINEINDWLIQWEKAETLEAGKNSELLTRIQSLIEKCHKTLIKIFLYYEGCDDNKLSKICKLIYNSYKPYKLTQYLYRIKQSFIVQEEQLEKRHEIDLTSLIEIFQKHFSLFLSNNEISPLLFIEIKSNLALEDKIGLSRLEELFFLVLGSEKNFQIFLRKNFWYCEIESALNENQISLEALFESKRSLKVFQIELKENFLNGFRPERVILDCSGEAGSERFKQYSLATIGKDVQEFENDIKLVSLKDIDSVSALLYSQNSQLYLIDIGSLSPIRLYAMPQKGVVLESGQRIFIGSHTEVQVFILAERTIKLIIVYKKEDPRILEGIRLKPPARISIGANAKCSFKVMDPDIGQKALEIYEDGNVLYFKAFNQCTSYSLKTLSEIESRKSSRPALLEHNQIFIINFFWFEVYISQ